IKVFDPSGRKLDDATERQIELDVAEGRVTQPPNAEQSRATERDGSLLHDRYLNYLQHQVAHDLRLEELKMVLDSANGAAFEIAPQLFDALRADGVSTNNQANGRNIHVDCSSLHIEGLQQRVMAEGADIGVALDGAADRALFVDADGHLVDGDSAMWVLANY